MKRGLAFAMVGSMLTLGAGALAPPRALQRQSYSILEEGPRLSQPPAHTPDYMSAESSGPQVCSTASSLEELILELKRSSVMIDTEEGLGSGVIIAHQGGDTVILTNRHVVESDDPGPDKLPVAAAGMTVHNDGTEAKAAKVLLAPRGLDLAIVIVHGDIGPAVRMANATIRRGTGVVAIGSPMGIEDSATKGIISNFVPRTSDGGYGFVALQTDAAINPGNSGGGLFLSDTGELLGITTFKLRISPFETAEGMGFVIPVSVLSQLPISAWRELPMPAASHSRPDAGSGSPGPG